MEESIEKSDSSITYVELLLLEFILSSVYKRKGAPLNESLYFTSLGGVSVFF
jgi:hypothetical protein